MCQDLQAVLVVPHKLLVDVQHGQQDVEQVSCRHIKLFKSHFITCTLTNIGMSAL